jgi:hypothetical protein
VIEVDRVVTMTIVVGVTSPDDDTLPARELVADARRLHPDCHNLEISDVHVKRHKLYPDYTILRHVHVIPSALDVPFEVISREMVRRTLDPFVAKPV